MEKCNLEAISTTIKLTNDIQSEIFKALNEVGTTPANKIFGEVSASSPHSDFSDFQETSSVDVNLSEEGTIELNFNIIAGVNELAINAKSNDKKDRFFMLKDEVATMNLVGTLTQTSTGVEVETTKSTSSHNGRTIELATVGANALATVIANLLNK